MFIMLLPGIFFVLVVNIVKHVLKKGLEFETKEVVTEVVEWVMVLVCVLMALSLVFSPNMFYVRALGVNDLAVFKELIGMITSITVILFRSFTLVSKK